MKIFTSAIRLNTKKETEEIRITDQVEAVLLESAVTDGMIFVYTGHTTAAIHLSNADRNLELDLHDFLNEWIPNKPGYRHNKGDYGKNADAHFKSLLVGNSIVVPITRGRLALGEWQAIYFSEFDGPRSRLISVKVIGTGK